VAIPDESCYGYPRVVCPRRILRALFVASVAVIAWATARPCWAASTPYAPLCDDRGASAIAPPPTFEATDEAIRRARAPSCGTDAPSLFASIRSGRATASPKSHSVELGLPIRLTWTVSRVSEAVTPSALDQIDSHGVRARVERPPELFRL
jgi:hypothetical protein